MIHGHQLLAWSAAGCLFLVVSPYEDDGFVVTTVVTTSVVKAATEVATTKSLLRVIEPHGQGIRATNTTVNLICEIAKNLNQLCANQTLWV